MWARHDGESRGGFTGVDSRGGFMGSRERVVSLTLPRPVERSGSEATSETTKI